MSSHNTDNRADQGSARSQPLLSQPAATPAAMALDKNFRNAVTCLRRDLVRSIYYLRVIYDRKVFRMLGYSNIRHYAAEVGGLSESQCKAFLRIGARLEELPEMQRALEEGSITWRKANVIVGQAAPENEKELVELARNLTENLLQESVPQPRAMPEARSPVPSEPQPKEQPRATPEAMPDPPPTPAPEATLPQTIPPARPSTEPCYVAFKFTPEQYSQWAAFNARKGGQTKEEALISALNHQGNPSGPEFLIILQECPAYGGGTITNNRGTFEAPKPLLETAHCDAVIQDQEARRRRVIPPRLKRQILQRDGHRCQAKNCPNTQHLQIHHRVPIAQGGETQLDNLVTLCARCHRALHESEMALSQVNIDPTA